MSIQETLNNKKPIIDTAVRLFGYAIVGSWAVSQYVAKDENKSNNMISRVEILEKRADNSDVLHNQTNKRVDDHEVKIAVINTNMENMAEKTNEVLLISQNTKFSIDEIKEIIKNNK